MSAKFEYDLFICHASEDKEDFVRPLASALIEAGFRVWYDEFSLELGDPLRRKIEYGLSSSRYGVVVLSESFFDKKWTQAELDGLFEREGFNESVILPIWHNVDHKYILSKSPIISGRKAVKTSEGLDVVVKAIAKKLDPNAYVLVKDHNILTVSPDKIKLANNDSKLINQITLTNRSASALYVISVVFRLEGIAAEDVDMDVTPPSAPIEFTIDNKLMSADKILLGGNFEEAEEALVLVLRSIEPRSSRTITVHAEKEVESWANISIGKFQVDPAPIMTRGENGIMMAVGQMPKDFGFDKIRWYMSNIPGPVDYTKSFYR